jgi:hypothetical protein
MRTVTSWVAICSTAFLVAAASGDISAQAQGAAQSPAAPAAQARAAAPRPPSPATLKRARKVLLDAIVKEVATRELGDCTVKQSVGAQIVSVDRYDPATKIWPVHATAVCTGPNNINELPTMTFNMTRAPKGVWKASYVKDDTAQ